MIITRTPLRISLGGGGTDLPSYAQEYGGFVLSAAITKYVYITVNRSFLPGYFLKYSETEHARTRAEIRHRLMREALEMQNVPEPLEVVSVADVPAGTGLGSSGTFAVGLTHALHAYKREPACAEKLAREAIEMEMVRLNEPVGMQDQYIAAYGGLLCQEYGTDGRAKVTPLAVSDVKVRELRDSLMLFFVGYTRNASELLAEQKTRSLAGDRAMLDGLHFTKELGREIRSVLEAGRIMELGPLMDEHWQRKRRRSKGMSNSRIDKLYELAVSVGGATGGKLVGAGGSGFLLFQTEDRRRLRETMTQKTGTGAGLSEMDFSFDFDGSVVLVRNA